MGNIFSLKRKHLNSPEKTLIPEKNLNSPEKTLIPQTKSLIPWNFLKFQKKRTDPFTPFFPKVLRRKTSCFFLGNKKLFRKKQNFLFWNLRFFWEIRNCSEKKSKIWNLRFFWEIRHCSKILEPKIFFWEIRNCSEKQIQNFLWNLRFFWEISFCKKNTKKNLRLRRAALFVLLLAVDFCFISQIFLKFQNFGT